MSATEKECTKCKKIKQFEFFGKQKRGKYGLRSKCKECTRVYYKEYCKKNSGLLVERAKQWNDANPEKAAEHRKKYANKNPEDITERKKQWRKANPERIKRYWTNYVVKNPGIVNTIAAKRRAAKLQRTVVWANHQTIKGIYSDCEEINLAAKTAGCTEKFVVDHIIPLQGKLVSGLHVESNLQIILASENSSKGNKFIPK